VVDWKARLKGRSPVQIGGSPDGSQKTQQPISELRVPKKLESLAQISFLQVNDAKVIYGRMSSTHDSSESNDLSGAFDYGGPDII